MTQSFIRCLASAAFTLVASSPLASAITLQISFTNVAPTDSVALAPNYLNSNLSISNVVVTPGSAMLGSALPEFNVNLSFQPTSQAFPGAPGGSPLPTLLPGDSVSFLLMGTDFMGSTSLFYGLDLTGSVLASDASGTFLPVNFTATADQLVNFVGGEASFASGPLPGGAGLQPSTAIFQFTAAAVPEPSAAWLSLGMIPFGLMRRRRNQ